MATSSKLVFAWVTVFCSGAAVLMLEILGARLIAPLYGASLYTWAALISTTLVALAVGYWAGGNLADRCEGSPGKILLLLLASALLIGILPLYIKRVLLVSYRVAGFEGGVLLSSLLLFLPPLLFLGMITPYVVRTAFLGEKRTGRTVALSTPSRPLEASPALSSPRSF